MKKSVLLLWLIISSPLFGKTKTCPQGKHWVKSHFRRAYTRADGTLIKSTNVSAHCKSNPPSYLFWFERIKNGLPKDWPHREEKATNWSSEEIERVLEALEELPIGLWSEKNKGLYRAVKSKDYPNPATSADGMIVLYTNAFPGVTKDRTLARILAHELAHQMYLDLSEDKKGSYHMTTNWIIAKGKKTGRDLYFARKDGFVQDDGKLSPEEDFANNIEYFIFNPTELKSKTPHAYGWISDNFGDRLKDRKGLLKDEK